MQCFLLGVYTSHQRWHTLFLSVIKKIISLGVYTHANCACTPNISEMHHPSFGGVGGAGAFHHEYGTGKHARHAGQFQSGSMGPEHDCMYHDQIENQGARVQTFVWEMSIYTKMGIAAALLFLFLIMVSNVGMYWPALRRNGNEEVMAIVAYVFVALLVLTCVSLGVYASFFPQEGEDEPYAYYYNKWGIRHPPQYLHPMGVYAEPYGPSKKGPGMNNSHWMWGRG